METKVRNSSNCTSEANVTTRTCPASGCAIPSGSIIRYYFEYPRRLDQIQLGHPLRVPNVARRSHQDQALNYRVSKHALTEILAELLINRSLWKGPKAICTSHLVRMVPVFVRHG